VIGEHVAVNKDGDGYAITPLFISITPSLGRQHNLDVLSRGQAAEGGGHSA